MFEAITKILSFGFSDLNLEKIEAFTNEKNVNYQKLLMEKGFVLNSSRKDINNMGNYIFELHHDQINTSSN